MSTRKVLFLMLLILGLMLVACGGDTTTEPVAEPDTPAVVEEEEEPAVEEEVVEEPAAAEEVVEEAMEEEMAAADLDGAFTTFLADMEAYNTIGLEALNTQLVEKPDTFLLDVREVSELEEKGWIEGAVNIPLRELADNLDQLPSFDTQIISYCGSGWRCTIALTALEALGWEDVKCLKGGSFGGWVDAGYPFVEGDLPEVEILDAVEPDHAMVTEIGAMLTAVPQGFGGIAAPDLNTALVENADLILIDGRTEGEVESKGHIDAENVLYIPLEQFIANMDMLPADLDTPIVTYCGSGHRSTIMMTMLWSYGYTDVRSLKSGYGNWLAEGYPVVGAPEPEPVAFDLDAGYITFLEGMEAYNTIGLDAFNLMLIEEAPFVLDVRQPGEIEENGYIETAVNIPLRELGDNLDKLPSFDTPIVSYCGSGWRCTIALTALEAMGWENVYGLKGGSFGGWVEAGYPVMEGMPPAPEVLNAADVDPAAAALFTVMFHNIPEGWGVITADNLNLAVIENPDLILIDARRAEELAEKGIIESETWFHIPLEEFIALKDLWPADLDAPIVVYCGSGHRSTIGMAMLWSYGYTDVHSLKGGFGGWAEAGYPVGEYVTP
ncbi:MAG: hypothetical protein GY943_32240 [Chloroflexi bacterium]|nr:hypothetical protein [Chloroflexota bacterium]